MQTIANTYIYNKIIKKSRYLIIELLKEVNFKLIASSAENEDNIEILKGYVRLIELTALKQKNNALIARLYFYDLIHQGSN